MKIHVLSPEICNRIAAGEVIDGPYSVVKELIENSIDAGADDIEVRIEGAGKRLIQVTDNGCGVAPEDLKNAFVPHATSKIASVDDLFSIGTLGFRGEALASMGAVAMCEMVSKADGYEAARICCDGQKTSCVEPAAIERGTSVSVRNLFYNTPVRAKFMHPDKKEESVITSFVTRYVLGNPGVSFRYYVDGKLHMQSYGGGLDEAVAQVYGASTIAQCIKISSEMNGISLSGFIGNQNFFKSNKSYQSVFLNGRSIQNNCISTAMTAAYSHYAMRRQYPFYVLFLGVPLDTVDVNVHPNKSDVRFIDEKAVFDTVFGIVSAVLDGTAAAADFVVDSHRIPEIKSTADQLDVNRNVVYGSADSPSVGTADENDADLSTISVGKPETTAESQEKASGVCAVEETDYVFSEDEIFLSRYSASKECESDDEKYDDAVKADGEEFVFGRDVPNHTMPTKQQRVQIRNIEYRTTLFNTYLVYESNDDVYLIDQHAAHERLLYDSLIEKIRNRTVMGQVMLVPYVLTLNARESEFIEKNIELIREIGFDIEMFGTDSFRITEIPTDLSDINISDFFSDILSNMDSLDEIRLEDILRDRLAMTACKHAVKGGNELIRSEKDRLFEMLDGNLGLKCPHGRPICVRMTRREIEKMFKRIV